MAIDVFDLEQYHADDQHMTSKYRKSDSKSQVRKHFGFYTMPGKHD